jgi:thioredoxin 1
MATTELTGETFWETVKTDSIVLIDFWAPWCGPCLRFGPVFERVSESHPDIVFAKVDTEAEQSLAAAAGIRSIPTLFAFREGILLFSQSGALPEPALDDLISQIRALDMDDIRRRVDASKAADQGVASGDG